MQYVSRKYGLSSFQVRSISSHFRIVSDELVEAVLTHSDQGDFVLTDRNKRRFADDQNIHLISLMALVSRNRQSIRGWTLKNNGLVPWYRIIPKIALTDID